LILLEYGFWMRFFWSFGLGAFGRRALLFQSVIRKFFGEHSIGFLNA
jgi:hypothetical protein